MKRLISSFAMLAVCASAAAHDDDAVAHYLANEGVVVTQGDAQIAFDPLFRYRDDTYGRVPAHLEAALISGDAPFDSIDAVFISHYHGDHFEPGMILDWAEQHSALDVYASSQAIDAILAVRDVPASVRDRLHAIALQPGDPARVIRSGDLLIEVIRIPHAGWPRRMTDVENLAFRVTLSDRATVVHLGDSDDSEAHFVEQADYWQSRHSHLAMPPYWFFGSEEGRAIVEDYLAADMTVGIHVPAEMPSDPEQRPKELKGHDIFTEPGETRRIPAP